MENGQFRTHYHGAHSMDSKLPPDGSEIVLRWSEQEKKWRATFQPKETVDPKSDFDVYCGSTALASSPLEALALLLNCIENR